MRTIYSSTNRQKVIPRLDRGIQKTLDCPVGPDNDRSLMAYRCLYRKQDGFTLVELMITMVVFVLAMVAAANIFSGLLTQFKQQSSIAESNIEGIGGLELMRHDVEQAGFGLLWNFGGTLNYSEADDVRYDPAIDVKASSYNDSGSNPPIPRGVVVGNNVLMNQSDVLVIKATNVATNAASQKWEYIVNNGALPNTLRTWDGSPAEQIGIADHVIIMKPTGGSVSDRRVLMNMGGFFDIQLNNSNFSFNSQSTTSIYSPFEPTATTTSGGKAYLVYGVSPTGPLRMPFNRADFYIKRPADIPTRCEAHTGVLYKATVNHGTGASAGQLTELPLLDCVLDMQVVLGLDSTGSGSANLWVGLPADGNILMPTLAAQDVRNQLKEIRIYLIVQEGQKDISYTYVNPDPAAPSTDKNMIYVKDPNLGNVYGTTKNGHTVPDLNYRWKLHTIVITPYNLK